MGGRRALFMPQTFKGQGKCASLFRARKSAHPDRHKDHDHPELDFVLYAVFGSTNLAT
jgi:hypothetical protein